MFNLFYIYIYLYQIEIIHPVIGGRPKFCEKDRETRRKHGRTRKERDGTEEKSRNAAAAVAPVALYFRSQLGNAATISRGR